MLITPKTKVGELLEAHPELEHVLMEMSPAFAKLKNPVLRRTVGRVATLQQVAVVGGLSVNEVINCLRKAAGQAETGLSGAGKADDESRPAWLDTGQIKETFDANGIINSGESPMREIMLRANALQPGEILELHTPFIPAPIIEILKSRQFLTYTPGGEENIVTWISR